MDRRFPGALGAHAARALLIVSLVLMLAPLAPASPARAATYIVTNTNDSGAGSLRQAIVDSNTSVGVMDSITFNIPVLNPVITVGTMPAPLPLPDITDPVVIDGTTQPGFLGVPIVELSGANFTMPPADGLVIRAGSTTIRGLAITGFSPGHGIRIADAGGNHIESNWIGTADGLNPKPNGYDAIHIVNSSNNVVGSPSGLPNVLSGNGGSGVYVFGPSASGNVVHGNYIGTRPGGMEALANGSAGVVVDGAPNTLIGGVVAGARNVISANGYSGVLVSGASGTVVQGNVIGTRADGAAALPNGTFGVLVDDAPNTTIGGTADGARNVISGHNLPIWPNRGAGIHVRSTYSTGTQIQSNLIGTNGTGTAALANHAGVWVLGAPGVTIGGGNVISGNGDGVLVEATSGVQVRGNLIGTNLAGTAAVGNGCGVKLASAAANNVVGGTLTWARNVISGNGTNVCLFGEPGSPATGNVVLGNFIGLTKTGTAGVTPGEGVSLMHAENNVIGGTAQGAGNVISGNFEAGYVMTGATGTRFEGNLIGLDPTGTTTIPNATGLILTGGANTIVGGTAPGARNVITGNSGDAINITPAATGTLVQGNAIGTNAAGTAALGNAEEGVQIDGPNNTIGGTAAGAGNVIVGNRTGVLVSNQVGNAILGNAISNNFRLGIGLGGGTSPTPNDDGDIDTGPNQLQNYPVLTGATAGPTTTVTGTLNSTASTAFRIELFGNAACDPSGHGEGQTFLGAATVTTDPGGNASFSVPGLPPVPIGHLITATATSPQNNTSEFSACRAVTGTPAVVVNPTGGLTTTEAGGTATFTVALTTVPGADVTIPLHSSDPGEGTPAPTSLTFTPANALTPRTVTVTGADDAQADGPVGYQIVLGPAASADSRYNGLDPADVTVTNQDDDATGAVTLIVTRSGTGRGTVTGGGIDCGSTCQAQHPYGTQVTLTAAPAQGSDPSTFAGWGGACSHAGSSPICRLTLTQDALATAVFQRVNVGVQVVRPIEPSQTGGPALVASFTARPGCGPIGSIRFGEAGRPFDNARVTVTAPGGGPADQTSGFAYTPPPNTVTVSFTIQRVAPSGAATVNPIYFLDGCGEWKTFVGGGPEAFR